MADIEEVIKPFDKGFLAANKPYISHMFKESNAHISAHKLYEMGSVMRCVPEGNGSNCDC